MNENERLEEYKNKIYAAQENYKKEFSEFMKRRKNYTKLDEGVREEKEIRKKFFDKLEALSNEYKDILEAAQK